MNKEETKVVWVVYPDSVRLGLADENRPMGWFVDKDLAHKFGRLMYGDFYEVKEETCIPKQP